MSVAVFLDGEPVFHNSVLAPRMSAENLFSSLDEVKAKFDLNSVEAIAVDIGPGSFTGVRVGVMAAKSLAYLLNIDLIPVRSFHLIVDIDSKTRVVGCKRGHWFIESESGAEMVEIFLVNDAQGYGDQILYPAYPDIINAKILPYFLSESTRVTHDQLPVIYGAEPRISKPKSRMGGLNL